MLRKQTEDYLVELVSPAIRSRTGKELEAELVAVGIACSMFNNIGQAFEGPHIEARDVAVEVADPRIGKLRTVRNPVLADKDGPCIRRAGPLLAEHSIEILRELGYADDRIEELTSEGVIQVCDSPKETTGASA